MEKYLVDFGTGAGNQEFTCLEEAKKFAEDNICYTEKNIGIWLVENENYNLILTSKWVERVTGKGVKKLAKVGSGYYTDWY